MFIVGSKVLVINTYRGLNASNRLRGTNTLTLHQPIAIAIKELVKVPLVLKHLTPGMDYHKNFMHPVPYSTAF